MHVHRAFDDYRAAVHIYGAFHDNMMPLGAMATVVVASVIALVRNVARVIVEVARQKRGAADQCRGGKAGVNTSAPN